MISDEFIASSKTPSRMKNEQEDTAEQFDLENDNVHNNDASVEVNEPSISRDDLFKIEIVDQTDSQKLRED